MSTAAPESCNIRFVESVHNMIKDMMTEHKESHDPEPLMFDKNDVRRVLTTCGAREQELEGFDERFKEDFGEAAVIPPRNIIDPGQFELKNSYVSIKVDPKFGFMVDTKIVDGVRIVEPITGEPYLDREADFPCKINHEDLCYRLFIEHGFEWGGDWEDRKDYQHFEIPTSVIAEWYPENQ